MVRELENQALADLPDLESRALELFEKELGIEGFHDPHLTLRGLKLIYERNND